MIGMMATLTILIVGLYGVLFFAVAPALDRISDEIKRLADAMKEEP